MADLDFSKVQFEFQNPSETEQEIDVGVEEESDDFKTEDESTKTVESLSEVTNESQTGIARNEDESQNTENETETEGTDDLESVAETEGTLENDEYTEYRFNGNFEPFDLSNVPEHACRLIFLYSFWLFIFLAIYLFGYLIIRLFIWLFIYLAI